MLHTFETTSKYTARREQRKRLMKEMAKRSESDVLIGVSDIDLESSNNSGRLSRSLSQHSPRSNPASPESAVTTGDGLFRTKTPRRSPSLVSYSSARQLVNDEDFQDGNTDTEGGLALGFGSSNSSSESGGGGSSSSKGSGGLDDTVDWLLPERSGWSRSPSRSQSPSQTAHFGTGPGRVRALDVPAQQQDLNLQEIALTDDLSTVFGADPADEYMHQPKHGRSCFMRCYTCWTSNFRCSKRCVWTVAIAITVLTIVLVAVGATVGTGSNTDPSAEPALPHVTQTHPEHSPERQREVHGLLTSILIHFRALEVPNFEDMTTPQRQAVEFVATTSIARQLQRSHQSIQDWTSHPLLREVMQLYALRVLWYSTKGLNWVDRTNWESVDSEPCDYAGVTCEPYEVAPTVGRPDLNVSLKSGSALMTPSTIQVVKNITLESNGLDGTVPTEMALLRELEAIVLTNNVLQGSLPETIGHLGSLRTIRLGKNKLQNQVPARWAALRHLEELDVHENELRGAFPWSAWPALRILALNHNSMSGTIPPTVGESVPALEVLRVGVNRISGRLPSEIGALPELTELSMNGNRLIGPVPGTLRSCTKLELLDLAENQLTGDVLGVINSIRALTTLSLGHNGFDTTMTDTFVTTLSNLRVLSIEHNAVIGEIPAKISSMTGLKTLTIGTNKLQGTIPPEIGSLSALRVLDLSMNQLRGRVPDALGSLSELREVRLEDNNFSGSVPVELLSLDRLVSLRLHHNDLTGSISALCPLEDLSLQSLTADCQSEVTCSCCTECF